MPLVLETGEGVVGADTYTSLEDANTYWARRPHHTFAALWAEAPEANREGALRDAAMYLDGALGPYLRGDPLVEGQGLAYPRNYIADDQAIYTEVPVVLEWAQCELAARALREPLMADAEAKGGEVVSESLEMPGLKEATTYAPKGTVPTEPFARFPFLQGLLYPITLGAGGSALGVWVR